VWSLLENRPVPGLVGHATAVDVSYIVLGEGDATGKKLSFQCSHGGVPCRAKIVGETEEEVLARAVEHARARHGVDLTQARYAQSLIREESG
jgi:predicted small metal-binding protein